MSLYIRRKSILYALRIIIEIFVPTTAIKASYEFRRAFAWRVNTYRETIDTLTVLGIKEKAFKAFLDSTVWIFPFTSFGVSFHAYYFATYLPAILNWLTIAAIVVRSFETRWALIFTKGTFAFTFVIVRIHAIRTI